MNNEMKEILDKLRSTDNSKMDFTYTIIQKLEAKSLYNYITNLQEERNMFKGSFETMSKNYFEEKSKNEKAIEYMNNYIEVEDAPINERIKTEFKEVIRLLKGSDDNE